MTRVLLLLCFAFIAIPRHAYAEDAATKTAKKHFDRGQKLFDTGRFDEALGEYQKAYDAKPLPDFLFNIGQCYRNLGDYDAAVFSYRKYLKLAPDAANREQVEQLIRDLEARKAQSDTRRLGLARPAPQPPPPPAEHPPDRPIYTRWWFLTGVAVVGVAGGVTIYELASSGGPPSTSLGNIVFGK